MRPDLDAGLFTTAGTLLAVSLAFAALIDRFHVPKVTAYLLVGMLAGSHGFGWVSTETMHALEPFADLAMAFVLFNLGSLFPISKLSRLKRLLPLSLGEQVATLVIVTIGLWLATGDVSKAVLLGALALATAPATTVLVLKDIQSRGPVTELASGLVVLNNLICILLFETLLLLFVDGHNDTAAGGATGLIVRFAGSLLLGFVAGISVSYFSGLLSSKRWLIMLVAVAAALLGICETFHVPYMLAFLMMGSMVMSFSSEAKELTKQIDNPTALLCVIFFVFHGSELDLKQFYHAGVLGISYIVCRIIGKYVGIFASATVVKEIEDVRRWLGITQFAQAGAAIALCTIAVKHDPVLGKELQTIILGSVVFFEIMGPLCIRFGALHAGEIPIARAFYHLGHTPLEQAKELWSRVSNAFGGGMLLQRSLDQLAVADIMRRGQSISEAATFEEVVDYIEHSHDDIFPVVNETGVPVGVIRYAAINDILYDPDAVNLVIASDIMGPIDRCVTKSDQAKKAIHYLQQSNDDCLLVTDDSAPYGFLGIVRRSDVTTLLIQERKAMQNSGVVNA